ncbi:MAG: stage 0 sporulation protein [Epulopiscium sp. Nuni2H_MBin001]|nr:MAG: stage 0 sporulation protein [Epulopiscium sp. Nuni2H_MBin001]
MAVVIGVRFKTVTKVYFFDPEGVEYAKGENVIVETSRGLEYGEVVQSNRELEDSEDIPPLKPVVRIATPEDYEIVKANKVKEKEAFFICKNKIAKHGLNMKLIEVEYTFDNTKLLFYFTSEERVDFRELVKDLAAIFRTRIELRQIGVRDETKLCGGVGICGRELCCHAFLNDFHTVSIKMAKDQNLSLNPVKISGICGRLMCCLQYEDESYIEIRERLPEVGEIVMTPDGKGEVLAVNVLREQIRVAVKRKDKDTKEAFVYSSGDIKLAREMKGCGGCSSQGCCNDDKPAVSKKKPQKRPPKKKGNDKHENR